MLSDNTMSKFRMDIPENLYSILDEIADNLSNEYKKCRADWSHYTIASLFRRTSGFHYSKEGIISRLMLIETYYATNASYNYFAFEEMADAIKKLGNECQAKQFFAEMVINPQENIDTQKVFLGHYGCHKNVSQGSQQLSLLSKYAYYQIFQDKCYPLGFPIYDKLGHQEYPQLCKLLGLTPMPNNTLEMCIRNHILAFEEIRSRIWGDYRKCCHGIQQFDLLDAYLWRMGKFGSGSLFNLMSCNDYKKFIKNLDLDYKDESKSEYQKRIYDTYNVVVKDPQIIRKDQVKNKKEKYTIDFDKLVLFHLKHPRKGIDPFEELEQKEYFDKLYKHWLLYYSNFKTHKNNTLY